MFKSNQKEVSGVAWRECPEAVPGLRDWDTADVIRNPTILNLYSSPTLGRLREPCESECPRNPVEFPDFVLKEGLHVASLMRLDQFAIAGFGKRRV